MANVKLILKTLNREGETNSIMAFSSGCENSMKLTIGFVVIRARAFLYLVNSFHREQ